MKTRASVGFAVWMGVIALIVALAALAISGCDSGSQAATDGNDGTTPPASVGGVTELTKADEGKSFTVKVGDKISVVLEGNPTTGYAWSLDMTDEDAQLLTVTSEEPEYTPDSVSGDVVGSGGKYTYTFAAAAPGQAELKLKYWRSFEPDSEPDETFSVNITIE